MIDSWPQALDFVLAKEGGYSNNPMDPGGETKYGISKRAFPAIDIARLTLEEAGKIYKRAYWDECNCDELPPPWDFAVFDCAVNQGPMKAKRMAQMALGVSVDGKIGPKTISAAHSADKDKIKLFLGRRLAEYARTVSENPHLGIFSFGWACRVLDLAEIAFNKKVI